MNSFLKTTHVLRNTLRTSRVPVNRLIVKTIHVLITCDPYLQGALPSVPLIISLTVGMISEVSQYSQWNTPPSSRSVFLHKLVYILNFNQKHSCNMFNFNCRSILLMWSSYWGDLLIEVTFLLRWPSYWGDLLKVIFLLRWPSYWGDLLKVIF